LIIVQLLLGFGLLLAGGELLVRGSVGLALKLQVSRVVIGLTLVAFATSAPELLVSAVAAMDGRSDIALGNVIGSNIANIGLILGLTAIVFKMQAVQLTYRKDWIFLLLANALLGLFLWLGGLEFWQGLIFVLLLVGYNVVKIRGARKNRELHIGDDLEVEAMPIVKGLLFLIAGAASLRFGALYFVEGIASAAAVLGMSERFISVTLVAFGTSVPELAASIMAARKGESDIAIGNIIGSNIFNILSVLGFTALIQPITTYDPALFTSDFWVSVGLSLLIIPLMGWFTKDRLDRLEGALLLGIYLLFVANLLL
jgi:cation:H+ antiporter